MRNADNLDRHYILDEFEFRPDWTNHGVTCPLVQKKPIFDLVRSIACLVFDRNFMKLADNLDGHKISDVFYLP